MYSTDWAETVAADEDERFGRLAERMTALREANDRKHQERARGLHRLAHAGVRGHFRVLDPSPLPPELQVGPFRPGADYPVYVRFSNGNWGRAKDDAADVRGVALKLVGVPGKKLLFDAVTQDFLLNFGGTVSVATPDEFVALATAFSANPLTAPFKMIGELGFGRALAILRGTQAGLAKPFPGYGCSAFTTVTPFRLGPAAARFGLDGGGDAARRGPSLTADLRARLRDGLRFTFRVQLYQDATRTPLEDPRRDWDAPWLDLATLELPPTDLDTPEAAAVAAYVETLAFDPWHAVEELRPLGALNRARKAVYHAASAGPRGAAAEPTE